MLWKFIRKIKWVTSVLNFSDQVLVFQAYRVWILLKVIFFLVPKSETSSYLSPALPILIQAPFLKAIWFTLLIFITLSHPLLWLNNRKCDSSLGPSVVKHFRTFSQARPPLYGHISILSLRLQTSQKYVTPVLILIRSRGPLP